MSGDRAKAEHEPPDQVNPERNSGCCRSSASTRKALLGKLGGALKL
jgi:hypothetical protein